MKRFIPFFFLIPWLPGQSQQSTVHGIVSIHNSEWETGKRQYVVNAQVEDDFKRATTRLTDNNGQFSLVYVGVAEKAPVSFQVKKAGLQVVNMDALSAVAGQQEVVKISMATPDKVDAYKRKIYNIGKSEAEKKLEGLLQKKTYELTQLRRNAGQNEARIKQLANEVTLLEEQREKIEEQAQDLARRYAPVNLDDASPVFKASFSLFQAGHLDSALRLLQQANLKGKVDSVLLEEQRIEQGRKELAQRESVKTQRKEDIGEALKLKADLHKTAFQFDSAAYCFELLIRLDSIDASNLFAYAYFLAWLNEHDKSIAYYTKALNIYKAQDAVHSQTYEPDVARTQNNLGVLYNDKNDFPKAEAAYMEALEIRKRLTKANPQTYEPDLASTQNNLGTLYSAKNDFPKAEAAFLEALHIYQRLAKTNPRTYEPNLATTQNNLGLLYSFEKDFVGAKAAYLEALSEWPKVSLKIKRND